MKKLRIIMISLIVILSIVTTHVIVLTKHNSDVNDLKYIDVTFESSGDYLKYLDDSSGYTVIPEPVEFNRNNISGIATLSETFPENYNTETDSGKPIDIFPGVRNQGLDGDCWAFASIAASEYSNIVLDNKSYKNDSDILSEYHMAASMNLTSDENHKMNTLDAVSGGNSSMAIAYFTRQTAGGPILLTDYDKSSYRDYILERKEYQTLIGKMKVGTLTEAVYLTDLYQGSSIFEYSVSEQVIDKYEYRKNYDVIDLLKQAIMQYGAVCSSYCSYEEEPKYYNNETGAYSGSWNDMLMGTAPDGNQISFFTENGENKYMFRTPTNHAIILVGWDDNYSYTNFADPPVSFDGEHYTPENGAWIVRNSWGSDFGNDGYEYISYMDPSIGFSSVAYKFTGEVFDNIHSYDTVGITGSSISSNVFGYTYQVSRVTPSDIHGGEVVKAIGLYVSDIEDSYEIMIDTRLVDDVPRSITDSDFEAARVDVINPENGQEFKKVNFSTPGYKVLYLKHPIEVNDSYDIFVRQSNSQKSITDRYYTPSCIEGYTSNFEAKEGVCFLASMKRGDVIVSWRDMAEGGLNWSIKSYSDFALKPTPVPTAKTTPVPTVISTPEPTEKPKFSDPVTNVDKANNSFDVVIDRVDVDCFDGIVFIGIYDENGILVKFEEYTPLFDENNRFIIDKVDYSDIDAESAKIFIWKDGEAQPYLEDIRELNLK